MANLWYCFVKYHQSSLACITPTSLKSCIVLKTFCYGCNCAFTVLAQLKQIKLIRRLHYFSTIYHVPSLEQSTQWPDPRALRSLLYVYIIVQGPQRRGFKFRVLWLPILAIYAEGQFQLQYVKFIAVISIKLLKHFYTTTNMEQQQHLQKSKKQQLFALVQNSWHSWLSSCTALNVLNVQRGHPITQLTVAEREEHGPVIFLVATHRKFFIDLKRNKEKLFICINRNVRRWMRYLLDGLCLTMV